MSKSQRTKGAEGERQFCKLLAEHGFKEPKRLLGQARDGGGDIPVPPFLIEVKRRKKLSVYDFVDQAVDAVGNSTDCTVPVVAMRADARGWLIVMRAEDLLPVLAPK